LLIFIPIRIETSFSETHDPCIALINVSLLQSINLVTFNVFVLQVFRPRTPQEAISLCSRLLEYSPESRISPLDSCAHAFFDELRSPSTRLPGGRPLPPLFNFTEKGSSASMIAIFEVLQCCGCVQILMYSVEM